MERLHRWRQRRRDNKTLSRFRSKPSKFLREHTVNSLWGEHPDHPAASSLDSQFHLVENPHGGDVWRPGRRLGRYRQHRVKNYFLTDNQQQAQDLGRIVGSFTAAKLPVAQTDSDEAPSVDLHPLSSLNLDPIRRGTNIHTMDLSGCVIQRTHSALRHVMPAESGTTLQHNLPDNRFGPQDYGDNQTFVMMKKKRGGLKLYAQSVSPQGIPAMTRRRFP